VTPTSAPGNRPAPRPKARRHHGVHQCEQPTAETQPEEQPTHAAPGHMGGSFNEANYRSSYGGGQFGFRVGL
jgi:hypothetical protein